MHVTHLVLLNIFTDCLGLVHFDITYWHKQGCYWTRQKCVKAFSSTTISIWKVLTYSTQEISQLEQQPNSQSYWFLPSTAGYRLCHTTLFVGTETKITGITVVTDGHLSYGHCTHGICKHVKSNCQYSIAIH